MFKDGLYLTLGVDNRALVVIREDNGQTLWLRNFVSVEAALAVLEGEVLNEYGNRVNRMEKIAQDTGFFTDDFTEPEDGFFGHSFQRYVRSAKS